MKLVVPSEKYGKSFLEAEREFGRDYIALADREISTFEEYIERVQKDARGEDMPAGYVPATMYWLVEGDEYVGQVNIRHRLTPSLERLGGHIGYSIRPSRHGQGYGTKMLALALERARALGIEKVLVTCDTTNVASRKVIEKNGGVLQDEIIIEGRPVPTLRFWIDNRSG